MKKIIVLEAIALFALLMMFAVYSANAEIVVEMQQDGSYLVKERTEKTLASIPPLPKGISFDKEAALQFYIGELPGVFVEGKKEKKIKSLFPPTTITKAQRDVRIELINGEWKPTELPEKPPVEAQDGVIFWFLAAIFAGILVASVFNRLYDNTLKWLLIFYLLLTVIVAVASITSDDAVIISVIIIGVLSVILSYNNKTLVADIVAAAIVGAGASIFVHDGNAGVIEQYLLLLVIAEIVSFAIATGVKKIFDNHKTRKFAASVPGEIS